jgi:hypothetical protein
MLTKTPLAQSIPAAQGISASAILAFIDARGEHHIACGYQRWVANETHLGKPFFENEPHTAAASGAWTEEDTYTMRLAFNETPFIPTLTFHFADDRLDYRKRHNVAFGAPETLEEPLLVGQAAQRS